MTIIDSITQDKLLQRLPRLHWMIDAQGEIIPSLLKQWGINNIQGNTSDTAFNDIRDVVVLALNKKIELDNIQPAFEWLYKKSINAYKHNKSQQDFWYELKEKKPREFQHLLLNLPLTNNVWETAFIFKYAPDPKQAWEAIKSWKDFYKGGNPLAWSRKSSASSNVTATATVEVEDSALKTMHSVMGSQAFLLWQYGSFLEVLSRNQYNGGHPPSGSKYGMANALKTLEPAIRLGIAPDAQKLTLDIVKRYKGKDLVNDFFIGLDYCMTQYEASNQSKELEYSSAILKTIIPFAIQENFPWSHPQLDVKITQALRAKRLDPSIAHDWFKTRLESDKKINIKQLGAYWPEELRTFITSNVLLKNKKDANSEAEAILTTLTQWDFEPIATKTFLNTLSEEQWVSLTNLLNHKEHIASNLKIIQAHHPYTDEYKNSIRIRVSLITACMELIEHTKSQARSVILDAILESAHEVDHYSLPQPLYFFAKILPQYKTTWQSMAIDFVARIEPEENVRSYTNGAIIHKAATKNVLNAVTSLMMGRDIDVEGLLNVRTLLDASMDYDTLILSQLDKGTDFCLPENFDISSSFSFDE